MDRLVEHLFIFEGDGQIRDYNGNYTDYREAKKIEDRQAKTDARTPPSVLPVQKANDVERKEYNRLGKEIEKLEARKVEIESKFNDVENLKPDDITKLSKELADIHNQLEIKELRWLELSEMV
jgi:ABC transport system ATP-binding/permease protein